MSLMPCFFISSRAPSAAAWANSASAAMIATVCGFGFCFAAISKKPLEKAFTPSEPTGTIEKYLS